MVVAEDAQGCRTQEQSMACDWIQLQPASGEDAQKVTAGKKQHITIDRLKALDDSCCTDGDVTDQFTVRTTIAEQVPSRPLLLYLLGCLSIKVAVVPFHEVMVHHRNRSEASQLTCA